MFFFIFSILVVHAHLQVCSKIVKSQSLFHGIGFDIVRMVQILHHGILSGSEAKVVNKYFRPNYGKGRFNGEDKISTASFGIQKGAYDYYIQSSISFLLNRTQLSNQIVPVSDTPFRDEVLILRKVNVENIHAIQIPPEFKNAKMEELSLGLFKMEPFQIRSRIISMLKFLNEVYDFEGDYHLAGEIIQLVEKLPYHESEEYENIDFRAIIELDQKMMLLIGEWVKTLLPEHTPATLSNVVKYFADKHNKCVYDDSE